jgi:hypothetical protein
MRIEDFLERHGLKTNPFANAEEAQGDQVLLELLRSRQFHFGHPQWPKFLGDPPGNQTSVVFGFKGSGKTAMRLALDAAIDEFNKQVPDSRVLVVNYDEFNTYLSSWKSHIDRALARRRRFLDRLLGRPAPTASQAQHWRLAHHMDAILAEIARRLPEIIAHSPSNPRKWPRQRKNDALLLATVYLPGRSNEFVHAIRFLHRTLFSGPARLSRRLGAFLSCLITLGGYTAYRHVHAQDLARKLAYRVQVMERDVPDRRWALRLLPRGYLKNQPLSEDSLDPTDEASRYEMLKKVVGIARQAGYARIVVVIDKVDEPTMVQGDYERMSDFIKPLWNNKLLQTSGIQFKMLLPAQLYRTIRKADSNLLNTARLDKANMINPLTWSGQQLYEILSERAGVCRETPDGLEFDLHSLFDPEITRDEIVTTLGQMRIPRYASKFMNRVMTEACQGILAGTLQGKMPLVPPGIFHKVAAEMDAEIRNEAQDLLEV